MMTALRMVQRLHEHRKWSNYKLLDIATNLTERQMLQNFPIGQGSIWQSLLHLYGAEYVWLLALRGDEQATLPGDLPGRLPGNQLGEGAIQTFMELKDRWIDLMEDWDQYLQGLEIESLDDVVYKVSTSSMNGQAVATRRSDVLMHICTHAQYTTAQVMNMFRHVGINQLPDIMLISLARQQGMTV